MPVNATTLTSPRNSTTTPNEAYFVHTLPETTGDSMLDVFERPPARAITPLPSAAESDKSLEVRWSLLELLAKDDPELTKACAEMNPRELHELSSAFASLNNSELSSFTTKQLVRLVRNFLDTGFSQLTPEQVATLHARLPYEAQNELGL